MKKLSAPNSSRNTLPPCLLADWESLRTFFVFVETGSFSGAARVLRVTHATISRRLQMLEQALAGSLYIRRGDDIELTRLGENVLTTAREMQAQSTQLARRLAGEDVRLEGKLRVATTDALGTLFLVPRLPTLLQRWPNLDIEFTMGHRNVSLARRDADLAIRFARPQDGDLIAKQLGKIAYYLCGTAEVTEQWRQNPKAAPFIGFDEDVPEIPETLWHAEHAATNPVRFRSTSVVAQCMAARAGVGMALLPDYLLAPELVLAEPQPQLQREVWAVFHRDLKTVPRLRAVLEWLEQSFRDR